MNYTDFHAGHLDYFFLWQIFVGVVLEIALDDVEIVGQRFGPVVDFPAAHVAGADDGVNFVGCNHFPILGWHFGSPMGNMEIAEEQHQHSHLLLLGHLGLSLGIYLIINRFSIYIS